jgi:hypothetical protein
MPMTYADIWQYVGILIVGLFVLQGFYQVFHEIKFV